MGAAGGRKDVEKVVLPLSLCKANRCLLKPKSSRQGID